MNHHPELSMDAEARLRAAERLEIPMPDCYAVRRLYHWFGDEWIDFLWHYRRRSPLLFQFIMHGKYAGWFFDPKYISRKLGRLEEWIWDAKEEFKAGPMKFFFRML